MRLWELLVLAVGLSMDAFAVSICKGLALDRADWKACCTAGAWFGGFQALMPLIGYFLGAQFAAMITAVDHWIAMILLVLIGVPATVAVVCCVTTVSAAEYLYINTVSQRYDPEFASVFIRRS